MFSNGAFIEVHCKHRYRLPRWSCIRALWHIHRQAYMETYTHTDIDTHKVTHTDIHVHVHSHIDRHTFTHKRSHRLVVSLFCRILYINIFVYLCTKIVPCPGNIYHHVITNYQSSHSPSFYRILSSLSRRIRSNSLPHLSLSSLSLLLSLSMFVGCCFFFSLSCRQTNLREKYK